jgi:hypothetical protein
MLTFNEGVHTDRQIVLRIGINIGDIIIDGDDVFGDGVNVAARLEALCEPGGVCISRSANEQVRNKQSLGFADLGERTVKKYCSMYRCLRIGSEGYRRTAGGGCTATRSGSVTGRLTTIYEQITHDHWRQCCGGVAWCQWLVGLA